MKREWAMLCLASVLLASVLPAIVGCGDDAAGPQPTASAPKAAATAEVAKKDPPPPPVDVPEEKRDPNALPPGIRRAKADVGSGAAGHDYGQGIVTTPVSTYFTVKEIAAFRMKVPHALQLYKAEHGGHGPKSHQEFVDKVLKPNDISLESLPELPRGRRYVYDPKQEELMVEWHK